MKNISRCTFHFYLLVQRRLLLPGRSEWAGRRDFSDPQWFCFLWQVKVTESGLNGERGHNQVRLFLDSEGQVSEAHRGICPCGRVWVPGLDWFWPIQKSSPDSGSCHRSPPRSRTSCTWSLQRENRNKTVVQLRTFSFFRYSQCSSSLPSPQSFLKSHTLSGGTHEPWEQVNSWSQALISTGANSSAKASSSRSEPGGDAIGLVSVPPFTILSSLRLQHKHVVATTGELPGPGCLTICLDLGSAWTLAEAVSLL